MYIIEQSEFDALTELCFRWSDELTSMGSGVEANLKASLLGAVTKLRGVCTARENIATDPTNLGDLIDGGSDDPDDEGSTSDGMDTGTGDEGSEADNASSSDSEGVIQ